MNNKITLNKVARMMSDSTGVSLRQAEDFLRGLTDIITEELEEGVPIKIKGLGTFKTIRVESRRSVNISSGEPTRIAEHVKIVFVPCKELATEVNSPFEFFETIELDDNVSEEELEAVDDDEELIEIPEIRNDEPAKELRSTAVSVPVISAVSTAAGVPETSAVSDFDKGMFSKSDSASAAGSPATSVESKVDIPVEPAQASNNSDIVGSAREEDTEQAVMAQDDREVEEIKAVDEESEVSEGAEVVSEIASRGDDTEQTEPNDQEQESTESAASRASGELMALQNLKFESDEEYKRNRFRFGWGVFIGFIACLLVLTIGFGVAYFLKTGATPRSLIAGQPEAVQIIKESQEEPATIVGKGQEREAEEDAVTFEEKAVDADDVATTVSDDKKAGTATKPEEKKTEPVYDKITKTRYLTTMAKDHYGDFNLWPYIYYENKDILGHPDRIKPGTKVVIPPLSKYGVSNTPTDVAKAKRLGAEIYAKYK